MQRRMRLIALAANTKSTGWPRSDRSLVMKDHFTNRALLDPVEHFVDRHIGPRREEVGRMVNILGLDALDALIVQTVPAHLRSERPLAIPAAASESEVL